MKATISFDFGTEEIEKIAFGLAGRLLGKALGKVGPADVPTMLAFMQQGMDMVSQQIGAHTHRGRPNGAQVGKPPGGPAAGPFGGPIPVPDNVRPIETPEECFSIEATRHNEVGVGCCQCATFNGAQRTHCRRCGHKFCNGAAPPAPVAEPPPEGPEPA